MKRFGFQGTALTVFVRAVFFRCKMGKEIFLAIDVVNWYNVTILSYKKWKSWKQNHGAAGFVSSHRERSTLCQTVRSNEQCPGR